MLFRSDEVEGKLSRETTSETTDGKGCNNAIKTRFKLKLKRHLKKDYVVENSFKLIVPGDSFSCILRNYPDASEEKTIQGIKAMLREKKA